MIIIPDGVVSKNDIGRRKIFQIIDLKMLTADFWDTVPSKKARIVINTIIDIVMKI